MIFTRRGKTFTAIIVMAIFMLSGIIPALAVSDGDISNSAVKLIGYYKQQASCDDWEWLGLRWLDARMAPKLVSSDATIASDYARKLLGQMAAGESAMTINASIATLEAMQGAGGDFNTAGAASLNQTIWPVISLDAAACNGYAVTYNKAKATDYIAANQDASGGFDESGWGVDVDSTAHVLIALAPYKGSYAGVVNNALAYLKTQQDASGGFQSWGSVSPDSTAAVIEALKALSIDPRNPGAGWQGNMVEALLGYQLASGAFYAPWAPGTANAMTSRNALLALGDLVQGKSKYQNAFTSGLIMLVTRNNPPRLDSDASITVKVRNASGDSKGFLLIVGLYDKSLEKMNAYSAISQSLTANGELETDYGLTLPASGNYELRVFAWDNWINRTPLASPTVIPLQ